MEADLQQGQPGVTITEVDGLFILGNASFDDIRLWDVNTRLGTATFTITTSNTSASAITVDYATGDDTAVSPDDYTAASGTATILPGNTFTNVNVTIIDDSDEEADEMFEVSL